MGLLSEGTPLKWDEVKKYADHVREHGIIQLLSAIRKYSNRSNDPLYWGDELEYMVVNMDNHRASLSIRQEEILGTLMSVNVSKNVSYHQEYGRYMVESTPRVPFGDKLEDIGGLEDNMALRRSTARSFVGPKEHVITLTSYPRLGVGKCAETKKEVGGPATKSLFLPDDIINLHPRFPTLSQNIRERRGKKVEISVPVFQDTATKTPWVDPITTERPEGVPGDQIYMDAMGFGMGCCCVQLTFQGESMDKTRDLYDAMAPLTPLMLAISAASPIFRGVLADQDVRWNVVSASVDDRTDEEKKRIPKSRYDSIDCYISRENPILAKNPDFYNDIKVLTNPKVAKQLEEGGLANDPLLVQHFSHLFIRDPLVIFEERIDQDDENSNDHFENIQSTNWQTVRFKPPPNNTIGWRAEFRPMEIQITDFENAALCAFVVLMVRCIIKYKVTFYQPISQVEKNMKSAHVRDPIHRVKYWVRTNILDQTADTEPKFAELSVDQIFNGTNTDFIGLVPLVEKYLNETDEELTKETREKFDSYLELIAGRASGEIPTDAQWIRNFVLNHPSYKHDSIINEEINYDLVKAVEELGIGKKWNTLGKGLLPQQK